jgi:hypothetical protein
MWLLYLNPMQGNSENKALIGRAETKTELEQYLASERVEPYDDGEGEGTVEYGRFIPGTWHKVYRKGGPLEWYNPPEWSEGFFESLVDFGTKEDWLEATSRKWDSFVSQVPTLTSGSAVPSS